MYYDGPVLVKSDVGDNVYLGVMVDRHETRDDFFFVATTPTRTNEFLQNQVDLKTLMKECARLFKCKAVATSHWLLEPVETVLEEWYPGDEFFHV